jgi:5-methylthioadenosine/S-adenosylhomocysteine deaminase
MTDILVEHGTVITVDPERRIIPDGSVAIDGGRITAVAGAGELAEERAAQRIDARGGIVMPGLVNAHVHLSYSLAKGCGEDLPFASWLPIVFRAEDSYGDEEWYLASMLSIAEMVRSGTTCFADTNVYEETDVVVRATEAGGMRAVLGKNISDITPEEIARNPWLDREFDRDRLSVAAAVDDVRRYDGAAGGRIRMRLSPQLWPVCSSDGYRKVAEASASLGTGVLVHHTEARQWGEFVQREYGMPPTMMLDDFGILGPGTLLENASMLADEELDLIAATGTRFNYLPTANMKNYLGVLDLRRLRERGITVSLGTSGGLINNVNDMFAEMKTLALQQRMLQERPDAVDAETVLEMATIDGARSLGLDADTGSLEVGKRADLIVVDTNRPHLVPVHNPVSALVYCAGGADVATSIIDGRVVMLDRRLLLVDEGPLLARAAEAAARALGGAGLLHEPHARSRWEGGR